MRTKLLYYSSGYITLMKLIDPIYFNTKQKSVFFLILKQN